MLMNYRIYNEDCISPLHRIDDASVDLGIYDPPFGINETELEHLYKRKKHSHVIKGYEEAPADYYRWTKAWMHEAVRILSNNGSMFVIIGHTNLCDVFAAAQEEKLHLINHIIWKYNFGVNTKKKFVTSHYHILYLAKNKSKRTFNLNCRFGSQERNENGSALYQDLEDVFVIHKDFVIGGVKNQNKLPAALIDKLILYTSNPNDLICDFFMGNFTTAYSALALGRKVIGYELNQAAFEHYMPLLKNIEFGNQLKKLKTVVNHVPPNQGKKINQELIEEMGQKYNRLLLEGNRKKEASAILQNEYGRGRFSIKNILDKFYEYNNR